MINERTNNAAINWIIDRCKWTDVTNSTDIKFIVGSFNGTLPYRMAQQLKEFGKANGGNQYTGEVRCFHVIPQELNTVDRFHRTITLSFSFGKFKGDATKVQFTISEEIYELTDEDIKELSA